jgi:photosystem II stability/assembly factor-like uncharacterized protein
MVKHIFVIIFSIFITACATNTTIRPSTRTLTQLPEDAGAVAVRLTVSSTRINTFFKYWDELEVQRIDMQGNTLADYVVGRDSAGAAGSVTYFGHLPAGQYRFRRLLSSAGSTFQVNSSVDFGGNGPLFSIERGRMTYLGHMQYSGTQSILVGSPVIDVLNFKKWLRNYHAGLAELPVQIEPHGDERRFRVVQDNAQGLYNGVKTPAGSVLFTTSTGSIRQFFWPAGIRTLNTGLKSRAHFILPLTERNWIVGGDFGEVRETQDGGVTWQESELGLPYGAVRRIYRGLGDELIAFIDNSQELSVLSGVKGGPWAQLYSNTGSRFTLNSIITEPKFWTNDRKDQVLVGFPSGYAYVLDTVTYQRTTFDFPGGLDRAQLLDDGTVQCRCTRTIAGRMTVESQDAGRTWHDSRYGDGWLPFIRTNNVVFRTNGVGIMRSENGGKSWNKVFDTPYQYDYIEIDQKRIVATDAFNTVIASDDGGMTWRYAR